MDTNCDLLKGLNRVERGEEKQPSTDRDVQVLIVRQSHLELKKQEHYLNSNTVRGAD